MQNSSHVLPQLLYILALLQEAHLCKGKFPALSSTAVKWPAAPTRIGQHSKGFQWSLQQS